MSRQQAVGGEKGQGAKKGLDLCSLLQAHNAFQQTAHFLLLWRSLWLGDGVGIRTRKG